MLEDAKKLYEESACIYVKDWKSKDKNDLIREAAEYSNTYKYDSYISAIMLKYWAKMIAYYHRCKLVISPEDAHMWLTQAVLYAVEKHPWTNPKSSIYNDKNGPDKVVNRVLESKRLTFYQQLNRYNRKINSLALSLETLNEEMLDTYTPMYEDEHTFIMDDLIIRAFHSKDYFFAFLVDAIVIEGYKVGGRHKNLVTHLKKLEGHCDIFSGRYDLKLDSVIRAATYITKLSRSAIRHKIDIALLDMKRKIKSEQSGKCDTMSSNTELYNPNQIVEYYYTNLWYEDEVIKC